MDIRDLTQLPNTRQEAIQLGSKYYFTGLSCSNGHFSYRYVSGHKCSDCVKNRVNLHKKQNENYYKEYRSNYYKQNKEIIILKQNEYVLKRKDFYKKYKNQWYLENKQRLLKDAQERYIENKDIIKARSKQWKKENPDAVKFSAIVYQNSRRSKIKSSKGQYTRDDINSLLEMQKNKCVYCGTSIKSKKHIDHIMPLYLGGSNDIKNIQLLCPLCNQSKGKKHPVEFAKTKGMLL